MQAATTRFPKHHPGTQQSNHMDNPRVLLSIALSFLILLIWQTWMDDYGPKPLPEQAGTSIDAGVSSTAAEELPLAPADTQVRSATGETPAPANELQQGQQITVNTDMFRAIIDTQGGDLRRLELLHYPQTSKKDSPSFNLLEDNPNQLFIAQSGLRVKEGPEPTHHATFTASSTSYTLEEGKDHLEVALNWTDGKGVEVTKLFRFKRGSYVIDVEFQVDNTGSTEWSGRPYWQLQRTPKEQESRFLYTYTGGVLYSPAEKYEKIDFGDMEDANLGRNVSDGWAAMIEHYFLAAWIAPVGEEEHYYTQALPGERYVIGYFSPSMKVAAGEQKSSVSRLYAGPKLQHVLEATAPGLKLTVDYGVLTILAEPIYWLLEKIHGLLGNWGWSIIVLTMLIKLAFFKLSETSYKSMANMRKLAPRLKTLKERYGDDKQRLNQAMMEMYKKEKINPLGGCLPVLVQIPVFISLYWVLLETVEMRQAPFIFWLNDLSAADPYFVLPLIMGITMMIQQKLNPAPMDPMQAKVMMILPVVFTVFFAFFPSGLVLYWVVNNTLSIAQQYVITKRVEAGG